MDDNQILGAIEAAKPGIEKYRSIMKLLHSVDVSVHEDFQRQYKAFYRVRQKTAVWYQRYFQLLEKSKQSGTSFAQILEALRVDLDGAYEPSFSSKLGATIDPWKPVWDEHVLRNTGHTPPRYTSPTKHQEAVKAFSSIKVWYEEFLKTDEARHWICLFNANVDRYFDFTDIKKIDFILWQVRGDRDGYPFHREDVPR